LKRLQKSWIEVKEGNDFPLQNIPFGIFQTSGSSPHAATRIGDMVIDLYGLAKQGLINDPEFPPEVFNRRTLNHFIELGKPAWQMIRKKLTGLFADDNPELRDDPARRKEVLFSIHDVRLLMPVRAGDYTDFYSSIEHATNLGMMFRDPGNALLPNWRYLPVGYHGRTSSIVVSGVPIHRPKGQIKSDPDGPQFSPTRQLDFELEMAFITGKKTMLGESVSTKEAEDYIFGLILFNDLSARDIQKWEYVPLGPFLGKNFGSVISPWIVTLDALEPFRVPGPVQEPKVLSYLQFEGDHNFDIQLDVFIRPGDQSQTRVCQSNYRYMYWNMVQQLAHQTSNGCNINVGDIYASGTISGPDPGSFGSMLEITWNGTKPVKLSDGSERTFIKDNDTIIMHGYCEKEDLRIGFGEAVTKILPAN